MEESLSENAEIASNSPGESSTRRIPARAKQPILARVTCPNGKIRHVPFVPTRCTSFLLAIFFAAHVGFFSISHLRGENLPCCATVNAGSAAHSDHCPPSGRPGGACCPDCPLLLPALLVEQSSLQLPVTRPLVSTFPLVSCHATARVEEPPVPPPRGASYLHAWPVLAPVVTQFFM